MTYPKSPKVEGQGYRHRSHWAPKFTLLYHTTPASKLGEVLATKLTKLALIKFLSIITDNDNLHVFITFLIFEAKFLYMVSQHLTRRTRI